MKMYRNRDITPTMSIIDALKKMDSQGQKLMMVIRDEKFVGLLSAGDIQRAIIANVSLNTPVDQIIRKNVRTGTPEDSLSKIRETMTKYRMEFYPIVDDSNKVTTVYFWEDLFAIKEIKKTPFRAPVVIMAGGYGSRLRPLTNVLPKPLIPITNKTMLEEIFDRFYSYGCDEFYLSVNYKADLIKYYLEEQQLPYSIHYFLEQKPLGTAGSLRLLKGKITETFFVNNCDIIVEDDYAQILDYHRKKGNEITLVAALKTYHIPYGTVKSGKDGALVHLAEKPELNFLINSGMYILEPELLEEIPNNEFFHITDLIKLVQERNGKVGVFPVSEKSWIDMGDWKEYIQHINNYSL